MTALLKATTPIFVPSPQQASLISWVRDERGSAFVQARAGTGKTTSLIAALKETSGTVGFAAYNKKIADEIKAKIAPLNFGNRVRVGTFHSFGLGTWRFIHKSVKSGPEAATEKLRMTNQHLNIPKPMQGFTSKLVSLAKQRALGLYGAVEDVSKWYDIVDHFDLVNELEDTGMLEHGVEFAMKSLQFHVDTAAEIIDFDDMIYMPVVTGCRVYPNDWVFVDEAQDTNPARRAYVRKMLSPRGGRAVFVGDDRQAIYGFTGADSDAIEQIIRDFNCKTLPLTVTYRCPKSVVAMANRFVPDIEAHPSAPEGVVRSIHETELLKQNLQIDDAILCRNTRPLVEQAYTLIRKGIACHVEGRDIGMGLLNLANKFDATDLQDLRHRLDAYCDRECEKLNAKGKELQAEALIDRVDTIKVLADTCKSVDDLRRRILDLFQDSDNEAKPTLTLSTVHKSKGREWGRVFVLGENAFMPSKWARKDWQLLQENNLIYVAYTRAQRELISVHVEPRVK